MDRSIFTHCGAVMPVTVSPTLTSPVAGRLWNATPSAGVTTAIACAEAGLSVSRIIPPVLAQVFVFCMLSTFATIEPAPVSIL